MVKAPQEFKTADFGGTTPLDMALAYVSKIFSDGKELNDEIHSMCAVPLIMALLEHLGDGLQEHLGTITGLYLDEMAVAETKEYKNMIIQGLMMNFWYDQPTTIQALQGRGALDNVFSFILSNVEGMDKDFEVKRLLIGLSTLALSVNSSELDPSVQ